MSGSPLEQEIAFYAGSRTGDAAASREIARRAVAASAGAGTRKARALAYLVAAEMCRRWLLRQAVAGGAESPPAGSHALRAIAGIRPRDRETLLLNRAGFSFIEISQQTGIQPDDVGAALAGARRRLLRQYVGLGGKLD